MAEQPGSSGSPVWAQRTTSGWMLRLRVHPGASRTEVVGVVGEQLKIKVAAPPNEGRANAELLRLLGTELRVKQRDLRIRRGQTARSKVVEVTTTAVLPDAWPRS